MFIARSGTVSKMGPCLSVLPHSQWGISPTVREGSVRNRVRALPDGRASAPVAQ